MACTVSRHRLEGLYFDLLSPRARQRLADHVTSCEHCTTTLRQIEAMVEPVRALRPPPEEAEVRQRRITDAIREARVGTPAPRRWGWPIFATVGVAAAAAALFLVVYPASTSTAVVTRGSIAVDSATLSEGAALLPDRELAVSDAEAVEIQLPDGSLVTASPGTRFSVSEAAARGWKLGRGRLKVGLKKRERRRRMRVETAELQLTALGTRFSVERTTGEHRSTTKLTVTEGVVRARPMASGLRSEPAIEEGGFLDVGAGEAVTTSREPEAAGDDEEPTEEDVEDAPEQAEPRAEIAKIRRQIERGKFESARRIIARMRRAERASNRILAELLIVEAEADLAEGKRERALRNYLAVTERFPATRQAEAALFAAAQLAIALPDAGYDPVLLLRDYLATYPRGRFKREAGLLLRKLEAQRR